MKLNVGGIDRALRVLIGIAFVGMALFGIGTPWTWIGLVPLATGLIGFCPLYPLIGLNTCPMKASEQQ